MGLSLTTFVDGTVISASVIRDKIQTIEEFVNEGIVEADLKSSSAWLDSTTIFKPDFYGSPSPRVETVSGDTWFRHTGTGREKYAIFHGDSIVDSWISIPGLGATIRSPYADLGGFLDAFVMASFYILTVNGSSASPVIAPFTTRSAQVALFLGDTQITGTTREVFATPTSGIYEDAILGRMNISMISKVTLAQGTNNLSVKVNLDNPTISGAPGSEEPDWKHTFVAPRSFIVDVPHLSTGI